MSIFPFVNEAGGVGLDWAKGVRCLSKHGPAGRILGRHVRNWRRHDHQSPPHWNRHASSGILLLVHSRASSFYFCCDTEYVLSFSLVSYIFSFRSIKSKFQQMHDELSLQLICFTLHMARHKILFKLGTRSFSLLSLLCSWLLLQLPSWCSSRPPCQSYSFGYWVDYHLTSLYCSRASVSSSP